MYFRPHTMRYLSILSTLLLLQTLFKMAGRPVHRSIIVDAGPSRTKLKIYEWTGPSIPLVRDGLTVVEREYEEALTDYIGRSDGVPVFIDKLLDQAKMSVRTNRSGCPIYVLATAGMRAVPIVDVDAIFNKIEKVLSDPTKNPFFFKPGNARVISGEEEGAFAWVALNYHRGELRPERETKFAGVLDMNEESTQITFQPETYVLGNAFPATIAHRTHLLYAKSYMSYGQTSLMERINTYLAFHDDTKQALQNPCLLKGDSTNITDPNGNVRKVVGTSDPGECRELIDIFLRGPSYANSGIEWCHPSPCAIGHVYQTPTGDQDFYAISSFVEAPTALGAINGQGVLNVSLLESNAMEYCKRNITGESASSSVCFMGLYIPRLLQDAYGLTTNNTVYVKSKVDNRVIDWATGAMLVDMHVSAGEKLTVHLMLIISTFLLHLM